MNIPAANDDRNLKALRLLVDKISSCIRSLSLEIQPHSLSPIITPIIKSKLPDSWRLGWIRRAHENTGDLPNLIKYLENEIALREDAASPIQTFASSPPAQPSRQQPSAASALRVSSRPYGDWNCIACGRYKHGLSRCYAYQNMSVPERWAAVRHAGLCYQCLGPHQYRACKSTSCPECGAPHHSSLHDHEYSRGRNHISDIRTATSSPDSQPFQTDQRQSQSPSNLRFASPTPDRNRPSRDHIKNESPSPQSRDQSYHCNSAATYGHCFMMTALVQVIGPNGTQQARALIDGGSDSSFVKHLWPRLSAFP